MAPDDVTGSASFGAAAVGCKSPSHHLSSALRTIPPGARGTSSWRGVLATLLHTIAPRPRFTNPWPTWRGDKTPRELLGFMAEMVALRAPPWGRLTDTPAPSLADCAAAFPLVPIDANALAHPPREMCQATWVGHATLLVQMEGVTFLTDPVFSKRASPLPFMGPMRAVPPALRPEDAAMPAPDFVLLSHNHYDHLDAASVDRLARRFGTSLAFYVPLGLGPWLRRRGLTNVTELDWWQSAQHPGSQVRVVLTPAQHWSARGVLDKRATLWGGWAVVGSCRRFWFAGDTGYCPVFAEIGAKLGPFDLAAIPIGAYEPRQFMAPMHVCPAEAVAIHIDVRSRRSVGVHCCTFALTTEPLDEPPRLLAAALAERGTPSSEFTVLRHGATLSTAGGIDANSPPTLPLPDDK